VHRHSHFTVGFSKNKKPPTLISALILYHVQATGKDVTIIRLALGSHLANPHFSNALTLRLYPTLWRSSNLLGNLTHTSLPMYVSDQDFQTFQHWTPTP
jgi:hypothetical protein